MNRHLVKIAVYLIIPTLVVDSALASPWNPVSSEQNTQIVRFTPEALSLPFGSSHPGGEPPNAAAVAQQASHVPAASQNIRARLTNEFQIPVHKAPLYRHYFVRPGELPKTEWTMSDIRPPEPKLIHPISEIAVLTIHQLLEDFPLLSWEDTGGQSEGVYIGFVGELPFPVAIKEVMAGFTNDAWEEEIRSAQIHSFSGYGPRFYDLVHLPEGRRAYAMQLARFIAGKTTLTDADNPKVEHIYDLAAANGLKPFDSGFRRSPKGDLMVIDALGYKIVDREKYDSRDIASSKPAAAPEKTFNPRDIALWLLFAYIGQHLMDPYFQSVGDPGVVMATISPTALLELALPMAASAFGVYMGHLIFKKIKPWLENGWPGWGIANYLLEQRLIRFDERMDRSRRIYRALNPARAIFVLWNIAGLLDPSGEVHELFKNQFWQDLKLEERRAVFLLLHLENLLPRYFIWPEVGAVYQELLATLQELAKLSRKLSFRFKLEDMDRMSLSQFRTASLKHLDLMGWVLPYLMEIFSDGQKLQAQGLREEISA